ncbi:nucleoside/nucleotide kinase family protein [Commensalibacter oyaizuii]|uniref:Nucleoside/nucleotide kinase family protein n=1 Tax=Commensalibacter oyaizuii TaxID=3043873 RepID=A0ABT6Q1N5_9PROT|nr:nucleoside/nucleotide kinase family protein [Commensalibacter sp. TBRC 16381]MDI2090925.1 nucleoside/nucleotide kinase family protein [Commensalibacter sp. TBRC 16381]
MESKSETPVDGLVLSQEYIDRAKNLCRNGKRIILAIAGAPGSGKSTVAGLLHKALADCSMVVPMDGFHLSNKELERLGRKGRKGAPDTFDVWGYKSLIERLKNQQKGEIIYAPEFYRTIEEPIAGSIPIFDDVPLIITEGNYLLLSQGEWNPLSLLFDERWFVTAPLLERQQRLVNRHHYFGRSIEDAKAWVVNTDEPNAQLIEKHHKNADLIINWADPKK